MKPQLSEVPDFYKNYIHALPEENLLKLLRHIQESYNLLGRLSDKDAEYRYESEKWSIKELTVHLIDTERIFANRALRFARKDFTELPGFDQDKYAEASGADKRAWSNILNEYDSVRSSTLYLFESFSTEQLNARGKANEVEFSVNTIGYIIVGHQKHHLNIIHERYLTND